MQLLPTALSTLAAADCLAADDLEVLTVANPFPLTIEPSLRPQDSAV